MARLRKFALPAILIVVAFLFPAINVFLENTVNVNLMYPVIIVAVYIMLALGLNIVVGFAGLLDLGFVAFYALGAYVVGWLASTHFRQVSISFGSTATSLTGGEIPGIHLSFWLILIIAGAFTGLCGMIIGAPTLRLRGDYLAIVTLGFGEIIPRFFQNAGDLGGFNLTNGTIGIKALDSPGIPFLPESMIAWQRFGTLDLNPWYYTILVLVLITVYVNIRLRDSRLGRAWISVREDETAAAAMGINPVTTKLWAYAMGAVFGGLAGAYYGAFIKNIFPTSFSFNISILILCMVILGGMGSIYGVILGAVALQGLNFYLLPQINEWVHAIGDAVGSAALSNADIPKYNFFLFGILLVVMMLLRPEGIIPNRQRAEELHEGDPASGDAIGAGPVPEIDRVPANILEARGITKIFGGLVAVNSVDFDIPERSIVSLIGPNGAGKTTFFNMVSGLYEVSSGNFAFLGRDITRYGAHRRAQMGIGRTFQNIRLFGTMSALDNVLAGMHTRLKGSILGFIFGTPGTRREEREARERAVELLDFVGIQGREVFAKNLSYGDQRRLEIARALASEPRLLLLDEPTAGMNPQETARLTELIGRLREERGLAVLLIEHEMRVVMSISDRVTVLDHGEKISEGSPSEVRQDPKVIEAYLGTARTG